MFFYLSLSVFLNWMSCCAFVVHEMNEKLDTNCGCFVCICWNQFELNFDWPHFSHFHLYIIALSHYEEFCDAVVIACSCCFFVFFVFFLDVLPSHDFTIFIEWFFWHEKNCAFCFCLADRKLYRYFTFQMKIHRWAYKLKFYG